MRITYKCNTGPFEVLTEDIVVGTVFRGSIGEREGLFLRTAQGIVFLDDPSATWSYGTEAVRGYRHVDAEIIVHGPAKT